MRSFRSDNNAGLTPQAMQAIVQASDSSHEIGYGDDRYTQQAIVAFERIFGKDIAVFFVASGTAANTLAMACLTQQWEQILCHANSHCNHDESTAPERITQCRVSAIETASGKISPDDLRRAAHYSRGDVHQPQPGVLTISNATELGLVYTAQEMREVCETAHAMGYRVHVDGARFANAVAALKCDPRDITNRAGVDALSFGGTKNGLAYGEAVVFFSQGDGKVFQRARHAFPFHRKSTGHLLSKHRFVSAPFAASLNDGSWLTHADHANRMAAHLAHGLAQLGIQPAFAVQSNAVFVQLPPHVHSALQKKGHGYYPFAVGDCELFRLMCSFDTSEDDVQGFLDDVRSAI